jgi:hypothetical protein
MAADRINFLILFFPFILLTGAKLRIFIGYINIFRNFAKIIVYDNCRSTEKREGAH